MSLTCVRVVVYDDPEPEPPEEVYEEVTARFRLSKLDAEAFREEPYEFLSLGVNIDVEIVE